MIVLDIDQLEENYITMNDPIKNNIITNGQFSYINYSTPWFSLNTIYIKMPFQNTIVFKTEDRVKISFAKKDNADLIQKIKLFEENILSVRKKDPQYKIADYLQNENIIIYNKGNNYQDIILKISGIWETHNMCGLSFKLILPIH